MTIFLLDYSGGALDRLDQLICYFHSDPTTPSIGRTPAQQTAITGSKTPEQDRQFGDIVSFAVPTDYNSNLLKALRLPNPLTIQQKHKSYHQRIWDEIALGFINDYNTATTAIGRGDPTIFLPTVQQEQDFLDEIANAPAVAGGFSLDMSALLNHALGTSFSFLVKTDEEIDSELFMFRIAVLDENGQPLLLSDTEMLIYSEEESNKITLP